MGSCTGSGTGRGTGGDWQNIASDASTYRAIAGGIFPKLAQANRPADPDTLGRELHRQYGKIKRGPATYTALVERICRDKGLTCEAVDKRTAITLKNAPRASAAVLMVMSFDKAQFGRFVNYAEEPRANTDRPRLSREVIGQRRANARRENGHVCFIRDCGQTRNEPAYFSTQSKFRVGLEHAAAMRLPGGIGVFHVNQDIDENVDTTYYNIMSQRPQRRR